MKLVTDKGPLFSPVRGRHYQFDHFNTTYREIYLDAEAEAPTLPYILIYPFQRVHRFEFTWKSLMTESKAAALGLQPLLTFTKNVKELHEGEDTASTQKMVIVVRTKKNQHYLLDREVHPFIMDLISKDSIGVKLIFSFTLKICNMNQILSDFPKGNFLQYAENLIMSELGSKLRNQIFEELRGAAHGGIKDDIKKVMAIVNKEFKKHGFMLLRIMNEAVMVLPESQKLIDAQMQVLTEESIAKQLEISSNAKAKAAIVTGDADTAVLEKRTRNVGAAETAVLTKRTADVGKAEADVIGQKVDKIRPYQERNNATKVNVSKNIGQVPGTLVLGNVFDNDTTLDEVVTANLITKKGARNAA